MDPAKQKPSKSMQTSVPSIAIRFHCGDEDVDIYPSADDEGDEDTAAEGTTPAPSVPATPSRDASPIKEYFKGLGKRSTSVDSSMDSAPVAAPPPDKWRLFTELRGKITKTVEEKLTEMKAERKAAGNAPALSGVGNRRERLRAGADQSSISDSEDVSETAPLVTVEGALKEAASRESSASKRKGWRPRSPKAGKERAEKKRAKHKRGLVDGSTTSEDELAGEASAAGEVEAGEEAEEEPQVKFVEDDEFEVETTFDYRTEPPLAYFGDRRKSRLIVAPSVPAWRVAVRRCWQARWIVAGVCALAAYLWCPLNAFANGIVVGVFLTLVTHFTVGLSGFLEPDDAGQHRPFVVPDFSSRPTLETPMEQTEAQLSSTKCAGWMNELPYEYDPDTYHINNTQTVYVRLEGSTLRISHPRNKVQKRATWDERKYKMKFVHQRIYELAGCELKLLPEGLTRRRIWSKKYPLCLVLPRYLRLSNEDLRDKMDDENESCLNETPSGLPLADLPVLPSVPAFVLRSRANLGTSRSNLVTSRSNLVTSRSNLGTSRVQVSPSGAAYAKSSDAADDGFLVDSNVPMRVNSAAVDGGHRIKFDMDEGQEGNEGQEGQEGVNAGEDDFCVLDEMPEPCLYLFARADRQKEDWYRRLTMAIRFSTAAIPEERCPDAGVYPASPAASYVESARPRVPSVVCPAAEFDYDLGCPGSSELVTGRAGDVAAQRYLEFMARFPVQVKPYVARCDPALVSRSIPRPGFRGPPKKVEREVDCDVLWVNAMLGHVFYDLLASADFKEKFSQKIQRKLDLIKLPYFIENLVLSDVDLGRDVPMIHRASRPVLDDHGLWVDLDITFEGSVKLTLETKLNLMKLKVRQEADEDAESPPSPSSPLTEQAEEEEGDEGAFVEDQGEELDTSQSGARDSKLSVDSRSSAGSPREGKGANDQRPSLEKGSSTERNATLEKRPSKTSTVSLVNRPSSQKASASSQRASASSQRASASSQRASASSQRASASSQRASASSQKASASSQRASASSQRASASSQRASASSQRASASNNQQSAIYNSEIEDSAESSETEPDTKSAPTSSGESGGTKSEASPSKTATPSGKGVMRMVNKIVASKYFQQATEYKYIKRAMEGVSKTVITLTVEIRALSGQLAVNMPPPPSDRLWYGFRGSPGVWLKARPKFGERSVSMHRVVSFIEKKLVEEMEKKLVLPNMDDIVIPPMTTELP